MDSAAQQQSSQQTAAGMYGNRGPPYGGPPYGGPPAYGQQQQQQRYGQQMPPYAQPQQHWQQHQQHPGAGGWQSSHGGAPRPHVVPRQAYGQGAGRSGGGGGGNGVQLVVSNVHPSTSDIDLRAFLSKRVKAPLRSCSVLVKKGVSKEMAFVDVENSDDAQALIASSGMELAGRYLVCRLSDRNAALSHRDAVFAHVPPADRARMQLDEVSQYSVSDAVCADATSEWILRVLTAAAEGKDGEKAASTSTTGATTGRAPFRITDACSCVGGNTLSFSRVFEQVHASETHAGRLAMLKDNCKLAGADNVIFSSKDYVTLLPSLAGTQDCVFVDPPWGGRDYFHAKRLTLRLSPSGAEDAANDMEACTMAELCRRVREEDRRVCDNKPAEKSAAEADPAPAAAATSDPASAAATTAPPAEAASSSTAASADATAAAVDASAAVAPSSSSSSSSPPRRCSLLVFKLPNNFDLLSFARELVESCSGPDSKEPHLPLLARIRLPKMTFLSVLYHPRLNRRRARSLLSRLPTELSRKAGASKSLFREEAWDKLFDADAVDENRDEEKLEEQFWEAVPDDDNDDDEGRRGRGRHRRRSSRRRSRSRSRSRSRDREPRNSPSRSRSRSRSPRRSSSSRRRSRRSRSRSRDRKRHRHSRSRSRSRSSRSSRKSRSERNSSTSDGQPSAKPASSAATSDK